MIVHLLSKSPVIFPSVQRTLSRLLSPVSLVSCLMSPVSYLPSPASCLLSPVSHFLSPFFQSPVSSLLSPVSLFSFFCLLSPSSLLLCLNLLFPVSCLLSPVSRLQCYKCCRFSEVSDFMEQITGLGQFSDLNALSRLSGLVANYF